DAAPVSFRHDRDRNTHERSRWLYRLSEGTWDTSGTQQRLHLRPGHFARPLRAWRPPSTKGKSQWRHDSSSARTSPQLSQAKLPMLLEQKLGSDDDRYKSGAR